MTAVLGVDGGGTKTHAVVADESGRVLGFAVRGPSNWEEVGVARAGDTLVRVVTDALGEAGVAPGDVAASIFGLAGVDWESDEIRYDNLIGGLRLGGRRQVLNDAFVALRAGTVDPFGIVVIAGTGSVVAGRSPSGEVFRTLGLGPYFGDFGGGSDISEAAILAVAEAYLGKGPQTALSDLLCTHARVNTVPELLELIAREQDDLPFIASEIIELAEAGDEVCRGVIVRAGTEMGRNAALVCERLGMCDTPFDLVLAGGLFLSPTQILVNPLLAVARQKAKSAKPARLTIPPVIGAVELALELAGERTDEGVRERLVDGMTEPLLVVPLQRL